VHDRALIAETRTGAVDRVEDVSLSEDGASAGADSAVRAAGVGAVGVLRGERYCYVCKRKFRELHGFYHQLCPACAEDNLRRRELSTDLSGRRVLLTGGRVKIGFALARMMLRDGAELVVTTRFPKDTARRFAAAPDSAEWLHRLRIAAVDLRDPRQVLGLCARLRDEAEPFDIVVNNAAQTVRRPLSSYAALIAGERTEALPAPPSSSEPLAPSALPLLTAPGFSGLIDDRELVPAVGALDAAGLLPDRSPENSWTARLGELDPAEVLEVQLVNAVAPTMLVDGMLPLLLASPRPRRYVVNVTAVEGRFEVRNKTAAHPHTNMAKAALNMLTRTSAAELAARGVYMTAVDTGWITDENPVPRKERSAFRPPLDVVDGAARVYDPIVRGETGEPPFGVFFKDYREAAW
jgi:NAD(P)-dependent dehydrogenase (short-subunit alcohol dehydrogenase family)